MLWPQHLADTWRLGIIGCGKLVKIGIDIRQSDGELRACAFRICPAHPRFFRVFRRFVLGGA